MKTMTCKQLGGACDEAFHADTFEQMAEMSKQHGMEQFQKRDAAHIAAMDEMQQMMQQPGAMQEWFESKKKEFDALPHEK